MSAPLARFELSTDAQLVAARQGVRSLAASLGCVRQVQTRLATAASEAARHVLLEAGGGDVVCSLDARAPRRLAITISGRSRVEAASVERAGRDAPGLVNARRLVDGMRIDATDAGSIRIELEQALPEGAPSAAALSFVQRSTADERHAASIAHDELLEALAALSEREAEIERLALELEETNRGVVALYGELDQTAEQLRAASESKTRFLSNMSHEFRTPVNSILALTRLLLDRTDGDLSTEQGRQVQFIRDSASDLLSLVNDLLDLSKVEAGRLDATMMPFALDGLFASLRAVFKPLHADPLVQLVFAPVEGSHTIVSDERKVAQIVRNLISNALKFTTRGEVHIAASVRDDTLSVEVRDSGIGIAPLDLERIFDEFTQIPGALQRGGTGLGLPLSRRLAQLLGGDLRVESRPGAGSTFTLVLPVGNVAPEPFAKRYAAVVVDDDASFRYIMRHGLSELDDWGVAEAADGEQGFALIERMSPDIVLLDLQLPRLDGFAILERMAAHPDLRAIPVVIVTSSTVGPRERARLAAAREILSKSDLSPQSVRDVVLGIVGQGQLL